MDISNYNSNYYFIKLKFWINDLLYEHKDIVIVSLPSHQCISVYLHAVLVSQQHELPLLSIEMDSFYRIQWAICLDMQIPEQNTCV